MNVQRFQGRTAIVTGGGSRSGPHVHHLDHRAGGEREGPHRSTTTVRDVVNKFGL
jgi:hypothetical protein